MRKLFPLHRVFEAHTSNNGKQTDVYYWEEKKTRSCYADTGVGIVETISWKFNTPLDLIDLLIFDSRRCHSSTCTLTRNSNLGPIRGN